MLKRIAIDGTQGTGKTTLFNALEKVFKPPVVFLPEVARLVAPSYDLISSEDWNNLLNNTEKHLMFLRSVYTYQSNAENLAKAFIVDGSIYRIIAYAIAFDVDPDLLNIDFSTLVYDLIIYCPIEFDYITDGFRFSQKRANVDDILRTLYGKYHKGKLFVVEGSLERRIQQILSLLNQSH